jgi:uncharacterized membrane protein
MKHLKQLLNKPLRPISNKIAILLFVIALLGFADASYLTIEHYSGVIPPCSVTGGCEVVLTSAYSTVFGVPVALGGAIYYLFILVSIFIYFESKNTKLLKWSLLLTVIGFIASLWFIYVQAFILHSYCVYCLGSFSTSTILFVIATYIFKKQSDFVEPSIN